MLKDTSLEAVHWWSSRRNSFQSFDSFAKELATAFALPLETDPIHLFVAHDFSKDDRVSVRSFAFAAEALVSSLGFQLADSNDALSLAFIQKVFPKGFRDSLLIELKQRPDSPFSWWVKRVVDEFSNPNSLFLKAPMEEKKGEPKKVEKQPTTPPKSGGSKRNRRRRDFARSSPANSAPTSSPASIKDTDQYLLTSFPKWKIK